MQNWKNPYLSGNFADAISEIYSADLLILGAGRYSFVKLQYFHPPFGYDETGIFTTGRDPFNNLWNEWISLRLLALTKDTPLADLNYQYMFECLPAEKQQELLPLFSVMPSPLNFFFLCL